MRPRDDAAPALLDRLGDRACGSSAPSTVYSVLKVELDRSLWIDTHDEQGGSADDSEGVANELGRVSCVYETRQAA